MLAIYFAAAALFIALVAYYGKPEQLSHYFSSLGGGPVILFAVLSLGAFIDEGSTLEELGWRGFALPILLERLKNPLVASIALGILWWLWHFPREIPTLFGGGLFDLLYEGSYTKFLVGQFMFMLLTISLSIICTFAFNITGGSAWPAILIHGGTNVLSKSSAPHLTEMPAFPIPMDVRTLLVHVAALAILAFAGPRLGQRTEPDPFIRPQT
jgi:hypothetical protein